MKSAKLVTTCPRATEIKYDSLIAQSIERVGHRMRNKVKLKKKGVIFNWKIIFQPENRQRKKNEVNLRI